MRASTSLVTLAVGAALMLGGRHIERANAQECQQLGFTLASEFAQEFWSNLNTNGGDELRVNPTPQPLPYIWVALSGSPTRDGTIVRIDTVTGDILGEYRSAPEGRGTDPSRTTVDVFGNVWAGNRAESDGGRGSVVKIGLVIGGTWNGLYLEPPFDYCTCVDRDGDGRIRTSYTLGDILPWPDNGDGQGGANGGPAPVEDAEDECILIYQRINGTGVRHVSVNPHNNVWVGGQPANDRTFDLLDGDTGTILVSFDHNVGGYGGLEPASVPVTPSPGKRTRPPQPVGLAPIPKREASSAKDNAPQ